MKTFRIANWSTCFENNSSRVVRLKSYGQYPVKHGRGYCRLMAMPDGVSIYGTFMALAMLIHWKPKETRKGYLTDTGDETGSPYDLIDLASMTRIPAGWIQKTLAILSDPKIGWLEVIADDNEHEDINGELPLFAPDQEESPVEIPEPKEKEDPPTDRIPNCPHGEMKDHWNELCQTSGLGQCSTAWPDDKARAMWKKDWFRKNWKGIFQMAHKNEWCKKNRIYVLHIFRKDNAMKYVNEFLALGHSPRKPTRVSAVIRTIEGTKPITFNTQEELEKTMKEKGYRLDETINQWVKGNHHD